MDTERSLGSGLSIPQWMKSKMIDTRLDLDHGSFSPPNHDENFFYIRYPRKSRDDGRRSSTDKNFITASEIPDPNKHTAPCRPFITGTARSDLDVKQLKSNGTDDGFKGKAAACGTSIVKVAQQMVSGQRQPHESEPEKTEINIPAGFNPTIRRGSRSLPASPLVSPSSSPKAHRKLLSHKYFTAAFTDNEKSGSWILAGLLGKRETLCKSVSTVNEETGSVVDISVVDDDLQTKKSTQIFRAKPSELREMNFWSPTSM